MLAYILNIVKGVTPTVKQDGTIWAGSAEAAVDQISNHALPNAISVKEDPESTAVMRATLLSDLNSLIYDRSGSKATILNCLPSNLWTVISDAITAYSVDYLNSLLTFDITERVKQIIGEHA